MQTHADSVLAVDTHARCAHRYLSLYRDTWRRGVDLGKIRSSSTLYSTCEGTNHYVTAAACEPTGVALGHPLPNRWVSRRLWLLTRLFERFLADLSATPSLAFVRPSIYHVTVVNRTHFDRGAVHQMSHAEATSSRQIIRAAHLGEIQIDLQGLLLTRDGRLLARGYALDSRLHQFRCALQPIWPQPELPNLAHVKLAHVLQPLTLETTRHALNWLGRASHHLAARLRFIDVYTPHGRIDL